MKSHFPQDAQRLGVYGQSRSAWTAIELASSAPVAFDINVSPAIMRTMQQEIWAKGNDARFTYGLNDSEVGELGAMRSIVWQYYATGVGEDAAATAWKAAAGRRWFAAMKLAQTMPARSSLDPTFLNYLEGNEYDVTPAVTRLTVPVFDIFGLKDGFVPAPVSVGNLIAALAQAKNQQSTIIVLPDTGHVMERVDGAVECTTCLLNGKMRPLNPDYWKSVSQWIRDVVRP